MFLKKGLFEKGTKSWRPEAARSGTLVVTFCSGNGRGGTLVVTFLFWERAGRHFGCHFWVTLWYTLEPDWPPKGRGPRAGVSGGRGPLSGTSGGRFCCHFSVPGTGGAAPPLLGVSLATRNSASYTANINL